MSELGEPDVGNVGERNYLPTHLVADDSRDQSTVSTVALRAFNDGLAARDDVAVMLPICDGVTLIVRR